MSFSKAKIQRFNERGSEAPPPGAYDPKFDSKVKGIVLEKKERFPDNKSVCSNESTESHVSTASKASSSQVVNKAQLSIKKRVIVKPQFMSATKVKLHKSPKSPKITSKILSIHNATYKISDLKVDCANKQKTIEEHEKLRKELEAQLEQYKAECANKQKLIDEREEQIRQLEQLKKEELELKTKENDSQSQDELVLDNVADLKQNQNSCVSKLLEFENELVESRKQVDHLKSTESKTNEVLNVLVAEIQQHFLELQKYLALSQKCLVLSQKCDAINFTEVDKSHSELEKLNSEIETFETESFENDDKFPLNQAAEITISSMKTMLKSLLKCSNFVKTYMVDSALDTEYLYEDNEELRQRVEFESHTNQELTKNLRNISTDLEVLKKELKDTKQLLATAQENEKDLLALIGDMKAQFKEVEKIKIKQSELMAKMEQEKMELEDV